MRQVRGGARAAGEGGRHPAATAEAALCLDPEVGGGRKSDQHTQEMAGHRGCSVPQTAHHARGGDRMTTRFSTLSFSIRKSH